MHRQGAMVLGWALLLSLPPIRVHSSWRQDGLLRKLRLEGHSQYCWY